MNLPDLAALVREADVTDLPALAGRLREAELLAEMRLRSVIPTANEKNGGHGASELEAERLLTYQEAAEFLRCSASYVETLVRQGKIPSVRMPAADKGGRSRAGRLVRLRRSDVSAWAQRHRA